VDECCPDRGEEVADLGEVEADLLAAAYVVVARRTVDKKVVVRFPVVSASS
jgi:hypothetical protein